ncbi:hypothetical protein WBK31_08745 [Nonomuraea sp. N2-4H]|uniref:hypothetical protein n=1 Tax=Nonomuraea sp. N2-4H TaxID=3128898 RepID=UPI0032530B1E
MVARFEWPRLRPADAVEPEDQALLAEPVSLALRIVLEGLTPRDGDLGTLLALPHPEITFHADDGDTRPAATARIRGPRNVARRVAAFAVRDSAFQPITVNGGAAVVVRGGPEPGARRGEGRGRARGGGGTARVAPKPGTLTEMPVNSPLRPF